MHQIEVYTGLGYGLGGNIRFFEEKLDGMDPTTRESIDRLMPLLMEFLNYNTGIPGDKRSAWTWGQTGIVYPCGVRYGHLCCWKLRISPF